MLHRRSSPRIRKKRKLPKAPKLGTSANGKEYIIEDAEGQL